MTELRPWIGELPHTKPPPLPGYQEISHEQLNMGKLTLIGIPLIPVWALVLLALVGISGGRTSYEATFTFWTLLLFCVAMIVVVLLHELVHGVAAAVLGAKPSFGIGPGFAYTTFLDPMSKKQYLIVGLAPLIVITIATVTAAVVWPGIAGWMILAGTVNASGAIGDLWMEARILRAPRKAMFYDLADGFAVLVPVDS